MQISVKIQGKLYKVDIDDIQARPILAKIGDEIFEVCPEESPDSAGTGNVETPIINTSSPIPDTETGSESKTQEGQPNVINAPIPGVIVEIKVKQGDTVQYRQELCTLEAMKMKNSIRASRGGTVREVFVKLNEHVQQGQILIELEEGK